MKTGIERNGIAASGLVWLVALLSLFGVLGAEAGPRKLHVGVVIGEDVSDGRTGELLAERLAETFAVERLTYEALCREIPAFDLLVLPESPLFPQPAAEPLHRFLKAGGSLVALGGDPFARPLLRCGDRWMELPDVAASLFEEGHPLFASTTHAPEVWQSKRTNRAAASRVVALPADGRDGYRFEFRDNADVDEFTLALESQPATDADALVFFARADGVTPQAMLRLRFADGTRCECVVDLTPGWRPVVIPLCRMVPAKKGAALPATLTGVGEFTLSMTTLRHRFRDHDVELSEVRSTRLPEHWLEMIETDGFVLCEERDIYRYDDASTLRSSAAEPAGAFDGAFRGISALGFPVYGQSRYVPLLAAEDRYGRRRGWAAGAVINEQGPWAGSNWAIFGVENPEWYRTDAFADYLTRLLPALKRGTGLVSPRMERVEPDGAPLQPVVLRNGRFEREDGTPLFLVGENLGSLLYDRSLGEHDAASLDRLFRQLSDAGVNALRILNVSNIVSRGNLGLLARTAERWGVYLLVGATPGGDRGHDRRQIEAYARTLSRGLASSPALLGYDLRNEPYIHDIRRNRDYDGTTLGERYPYSAAGMSALASSTLRPDSYGTATFYGRDRILPRPADAAATRAYDAVNGIFGDWIDWYRETFARLGDRHPLTVGFNLWYASLPVGCKLDFVSQHTYVMPTDSGAVVNELTTMDRLHAMYPDKPVTLGEFGYTSGYVLDGRPLSAQCQALGEMMHLLHAWTHGYGGVFDWQVYDFDPVNYRRIAVWNRDRYRFKQDYERLHGIYAWDGTPEGMLKPYGMCMRFFSDALRDGLERGELTCRAARTQIGTGFVFRAPNALMVGDRAHDDGLLRFDAGEERVVCLFWHDGEIRMMATGDVDVTLSPAQLPGFGRTAGWQARNCRAGMRCDGEQLTVSLLAGETVVLTLEK